MKICKDRDSITPWDNLILNHCHIKDVFSLMSNFNFYSCYFSVAFRFGSLPAPSLHHVSPVLLSAQDVSQQHRSYFKRYPGFSFGAIRLHSSISQGPLVAFLFPPLGTAEFGRSSLPRVFFSKWICSYRCTKNVRASSYSSLQHSAASASGSISLLLYPDIPFEDSCSNPYELTGS